MDLDTFYIIAIRANSETCTGKRKLKAGKLYYLMNNWEIAGNVITYHPNEAENIYNDYLRGGYNKITFSSIVGENGAGKSSIVEFTLRLINNLAAVLFGEKSLSLTYEHLHYIDGIEGDLFFLANGHPYQLTVTYRNVMITQYTSYQKYNNGNVTFMKEMDGGVFDNEHANTADIDIFPFDSWRTTKDGKSTKELLEDDLFYTLAVNYSQYAYNTNDYETECNSEEYERKIRKRTSYKIDERCWLNGLFHKNDGYQVPIVLTPYREEGNIDINTENHLAKERLIAIMLIWGEKYREINGHLKINGFILNVKESQYNAKRLRGKGLYPRWNDKGFEGMRYLVVKYWSEVIAKNIEDYKDKRAYYKEAVDYLTYKTMKISATYASYKRFFWRTHHDRRSKIDKEGVKNLVIRLSVDHSHITKKIRQTLGYILYDIYKTDIGNGTTFMKISDISKGAHDALSKEREKGHHVGKQCLFSIEDLVPAPIFDVDIDLIDTTTEEEPHVNFNTLSSGERQQAYFVSSIIYHLSNLNSVKEDNNRTRAAYKRVFVVLEEIELYFHPQLQKQLILYLLHGLKQTDLKNIKGIHFCIITHSPFVLSDIPHNNILALRKDNGSVENLKTFGANYYDMLKYNFFFEKGMVGDFAQEVINEIIYKLKDSSLVDDKNVLKNQIALIDDDIIGKSLERRWWDIYGDKNEYKKKRIAYYKRQIEELEKDINKEE